VILSEGARGNGSAPPLASLPVCSLSCTFTKSESAGIFKLAEGAAESDEATPTKKNDNEIVRRGCIIVAMMKRLIVLKMLSDLGSRYSRLRVDLDHVSAATSLFRVKVCVLQACQSGARDK
jgi:hypothetical protein